MRTVGKETIPIITKSLQKWKMKPVIKVLDEHVALSTSFSSITPSVVLIRIKSEWLGTQYAYHMPTGSQPRVDLALWFASAIGPNFSPRESTPDHLWDILKWPPLRKLLLKFETHPKIGIINLFLEFHKIVWDFWNFLFQLNEGEYQPAKEEEGGQPAWRRSTDTLSSPSR